MSYIQDPGSVALSFLGSPSDSFGVVTVETVQGSVYTFPDMNVSKLKQVLPPMGRRLENMPCLVMVNASVSSLSVPFRIIGTIKVEDEVLWHDERSTGA